MPWKNSWFQVAVFAWLFSGVLLIADYGPTISMWNWTKAPKNIGAVEFDRCWAAGNRDDYGHAMQWCQEAAAKGNPAAEALIGVLYAQGSGVTQDEREATRWFQKAISHQAAAEGSPAAEALIGVLYAQGSGVTQDESKAKQWFQKAISHQAAAEGSPAAEFWIGQAYDGVTQDYNQAMQWYQKAAAQGDPGAETLIGAHYIEGHGVTQDYNQAMQWYQKAAAQGNDAAEVNIGNSYLNGWGVPKDYSQAAQWYRKAAAQGDAPAENNLANLYENGLGVTKDNSEALQWYQKAAAQGYNDAKQAVARLQAGQPPAQPAEQQQPLPSDTYDMAGQARLVSATRSQLVSSGNESDIAAALRTAIQKDRASIVVESSAVLASSSDIDVTSQVTGLMKGSAANPSDSLSIVPRALVVDNAFLAAHTSIDKAKTDILYRQLMKESGANIIFDKAATVFGLPDTIDDTQLAVSRSNGAEAGILKPATLIHLLVLSRESILSSSQAGKHLTADVQALSDAAKAQIFASQSALKKKSADIQAQLPTETAELKNSQIAALEASEKSVQSAAQEDQAKLKSFLSSGEGQISQALLPIISEIAKAHGANVIVLDRNAVIDSPDNIDITQAVIKRLDVALPMVTVDKPALAAMSPPQ